MNQEGWDADAFRRELCIIKFWHAINATSSVGYGDLRRPDLAPTTPKTQAFVSVYAIVGLVLVWSIVSDYYGVVQGKLQDFQAKLLLHNWRRIGRRPRAPDRQAHAGAGQREGQVLAPLPPGPVLDGHAPGALRRAALRAQGVELHRSRISRRRHGHDGRFRDFGFLDEDQQMFGRFRVMGVVVVFANAVDECLLNASANSSATARSPPSPSNWKPTNNKRNAGEGDYINEADYVVETLLKGELVDPQILLAIRRSFYWKRPRGVGRKRNSLITSEDLRRPRWRRPARPARARHARARRRRDDLRRRRWRARAPRTIRAGTPARPVEPPGAVDCAENEVGRPPTPDVIRR